MVPISVLLCVLALLLGVWGAAKSNVVFVGVSTALLSVVLILMLGGVVKI